MQKKTKFIPVNTMAGEFNTGISIEKISFENLEDFAEENQSHRHDRHSFFLLEKGTILIDIDFQKYEIQSSSVIYIHPNQVHHTTSGKKVTVSSLGINNENLNPEYLKLLENLTPSKPLELDQKTFSILSEAFLICLKFSERKNDKLYHSLLKDSSNAVVALVISQYLEHHKTTDKLSRFEIIAKDFKELLEHTYTTEKRPSAYAQKLNLSTSYLNECVQNSTGHSVSYHIQQRIILEAKRLLYHSDQSVKEIATILGYEDYSYFSRFFSKITGMTASAFKNKNHV